MKVKKNKRKTPWLSLCPGQSLARCLSAFIFEQMQFSASVLPPSCVRFDKFFTCKQSVSTKSLIKQSEWPQRQTGWVPREAEMTESYEEGIFQAKLIFSWSCLNSHSMVVCAMVPVHFAGFLTQFSCLIHRITLLRCNKDSHFRDETVESSERRSHSQDLNSYLSEDRTPAPSTTPRGPELSPKDPAL